MKVSVKGGCLCGAVRFSYDGELGGSLGAVTVCFCRQCRVAQGLGSAVAPARALGLKVSQGRESIAEYESSPGKTRAFCRICASPLYSRRNTHPELLRLRLGSLVDAPADLRVEAQIFTESAPEWTSFSAAPRYLGSEPGRP